MKTFFTLILAVLPTLVLAENWGSWRGPTQNGISTETNVPIEWSKDKNVAWRVDLPGPAGATPVVWNDRVFLTSVDGEQLVLLCFSTRDGKQLWRREISTGNKDVRGDEGNSASPSPITDGKHVWTFMASGPLACFTVRRRTGLEIRCAGKIRQIQYRVWNVVDSCTARRTPLFAVDSR